MESALSELGPDPYSPTTISADPATSESTDEHSVEADAERLELIFIDAHVQDVDLLIEDLSGPDARGDFEIILLDANQDGVEQITDELSKHSDIAAVHIFSHGVEGAVQLGSSWLRSDNVDDHAGQLTQWRESLSIDADLLFYGCELAGDQAGRDLVDAIRTMTGADVAASDDLTGHLNYGADWQLEYTQGEIETAVALSSHGQASWDRLLGVVVVTTTDDVVDGDTSSVAALIADPGGDGISLREAIIATNADFGSDTIQLLDGHYTLSIQGTLEDGAMTGDLDVTDWVTIVGSGSTNVVIDGNGIDRVFHVISGGATFADVTIQNGVDAVEGTGGGILNEASTTLVRVDLRDNVAVDGAGQGGGLYNEAIAVILNSTIRDNQAAFGAGVFNSALSSVLDVSVSTISGNAALQEGGGLYDANTGNLVSVTVAFNSAQTGGGVTSTGNTSLLNSIVASNQGTSSTDLSGAIVSGGHNLIGVSAGGSGFVASDLLDLDARLVSQLAGHAGSTPTHQLYSDSPAIDAGESIGTPSTDQTHTLRDIDGDGQNGLEHDIGAIEYQPNDLNSPPEQMSITNSSVLHGVDTTGGYSVGTLITSDPDSGETFSYQILGGADEARFSIGGAAADELILDDGVIDVGRQSSYEVIVMVTDSEGNYADFRFTIVVNPNSPPDLSLTNLVSSLAEDQDTSVGVKVADITINDDGKGINSLSLTGADAALFEIVGGNELYLKAGTALDFEAQTSLNVTVEVDDSTVGSSPDAAVSHSIAVTDVNEVPVMPTTGSANVFENQSQVTVITATDPEGDALQYSIAGGSDGHLFEVDETTGQVSFLTAPDYEKPLDSDGDNTYDVQVDATDPFGLTASQMLTVVVDPVNDNRPAFVSKSHTSVVAGTQQIMTIVAVDADLPPMQVTYQIVGGLDAKAFQLDTATGELQFTFVPSANFPKDFDGNNVYELVVEANDSQGGVTNQQIFVRVIPDSPPVAMNDFYSVGNDGELIVNANAGVLSNDFDPEGGSLDLQLLRPPAHGTLILNDDGSFRYKPLISFVGDDRFVYAVEDEQGNVSFATVTIEVTASSDPNQNNDDGNSADNAPPPAQPTDPASIPIPNAGFVSRADLDPDRRIERVTREVSFDPIETAESTGVVQLIQIEGSSSVTDALAKSDSVDLSPFESVSEVPDLDEITTYTFVTGTADSWDPQGTFEGMLAPQDVLLNVVAGSAGLFGTAWAWYLIWLVRSGSIVSTLMTQLPAWTIVDPLPVLDSTGKGVQCEDDERLESLVMTSDRQE